MILKGTVGTGFGFMTGAGGIGICSFPVIGSGSIGPINGTGVKACGVAMGGTAGATGIGGVMIVVTVDCGVTVVVIVDWGVVVVVVVSAAKTLTMPIHKNSDMNIANPTMIGQ